MRQPVTERSPQDLHEDPAVAPTWAAILSAARMARRGGLPDGTATFAASTAGALRPVAPRDPDALLVWHPDQGWEAAAGTPPRIRDLLDLYLPLCGVGAADTLTVGHLGQSLDGCIATRSGESCYVTGGENILHLHRMRALCDAVLVGAQTVVADDPRLTTRLVAGENPVRVVLDPRRRLPSQRQAFTDGRARTLVLCAADRVWQGPRRLGRAEIAGVPTLGGRLDLDALLRLLHGRGLRFVFIEGGGITVSAFLEAGLLDRLQVAVAPLLIGDGRPGLSLPPTASLGECLRPHCRAFRMGADVLFDCEPGKASAPAGDGGVGAPLARIF